MQNAGKEPGKTQTVIRYSDERSSDVMVLVDMLLRNYGQMVGLLRGFKEKLSEKKKPLDRDCNQP